MYEMDEWNAHVAGLMNNYIQLNIDPLGRACMAYLCLTTSDPPASMAQNLPETLSQATFDAEVRIPELVSLLRGRDVASAHRNGQLSVVIVRRDAGEVVFSRSPIGWDLSMLPLDATVSEEGLMKITWGPEEEQSIEVDGSSDIWRYINRHHTTTLVKRVNEGFDQRLVNFNKRLDALEASIPELDLS
jgi:hypothetical protein